MRGEERFEKFEKFETAKELLERIREARASTTPLKPQSRLKPLKRSRPLPPITDDEKSFPIPEGWEWSRFGDLVINRDGERVPVQAADRQKQQNKIYDYYGATGPIDKVDSYIFDKRLLLIGEDGANILSRSKPNAFFAEGKYWVNNHAHVLDSSIEGLLDYLALYINSLDLHPYVTGEAQPKFNQAKMNSIPVPLPPLAEQKEIVKRVEELLALVGEMK